MWVNCTKVVVVNWASRQTDGSLNDSKSQFWQNYDLETFLLRKVRPNHENDDSDFPKWTFFLFFREMDKTIFIRNMNYHIKELEAVFFLLLKY